MEEAAASTTPPVLLPGGRGGSEVGRGQDWNEDHVPPQY